MADGFAQKEKGVFQGEGLFSLVHEPFALLVIGPNSLVKRDRGSMSRGPKSARTLVWCSSVR